MPCRHCLVSVLTGNAAFDDKLCISLTVRCGLQDVAQHGRVGLHLTTPAHVSRTEACSVGCATLPREIKRMNENKLTSAVTSHYVSGPCFEYLSQSSKNWGQGVEKTGVAIPEIHANGDDATML